MATEPAGPRAYRAACPNCGAPVDFRSAASASAVCSFCRSTLLRDGDALRRIGVSAELFDDHSPLQLGAGGTLQGNAFTLIGRLQYRSADGTWNEWHALFDNGRSGWLSEDNGRYVMAFDAALEGPAPDWAGLRAGAPVTVAAQAWTVGSVTQATLLAAQGELPAAPPGSDRAFTVVDLRNPQGEVGTLDDRDPAAPGWSIGRAVSLGELAMHGLAETAEKTLRGRSVACPSCGNALELRLDSTQSVACPQCKAVVDVSQGVGAELSHYAQVQGREPQIPLGRTGLIAIAGKPAMAWQVVGYVERCEIPDDPDDERSVWREYLLYHRTEGFAFLVDAEDGWSWAAPITGVPEGSGERVRHQGVTYRKLYDYTGQVSYVLGEFYWRVEREQRTANTDYQGTGSDSDKRLNCERTGSGASQEVVWSAGEALSAALVFKAFGVAPPGGSGLDAAPVASNAASLLAKLFFWGFVIAVLLMLARCGDDDCDDLRARYGQASQQYQDCLRANRGGGGLRTGGGSFGGFSSGGGHK